MKKRHKIPRILGTWIVLQLSPLSGPSAAPVITLDKDSIICGTIPLDSVKEYKVDVSNKGNMDLKIDKIRSSCKCLNGELFPRDPITPGSKRPLKVLVDTAGLYGKKEYFLMIESNDPDHPIIKLPVTISILPPPEPVIKIFPESLEFGLIQNGKARARILIKNPGGSVLKGRISCPLKGISFSESEFSVSPGEKENIEISAEIGKLPRESSGSDSIVIDSNDPKHQQWMIPWILLTEAGSR